MWKYDYEGEKIIKGKIACRAWRGGGVVA